MKWFKWLKFRYKWPFSLIEWMKMFTIRSEIEWVSFLIESFDSIYRSRQLSDSLKYKFPFNFACSVQHFIAGLCDFHRKHFPNWKDRFLCIELQKETCQFFSPISFICPGSWALTRKLHKNSSKRLRTCHLNSIYCVWLWSVRAQIKRYFLYC